MGNSRGKNQEELETGEDGDSSSQEAEVGKFSEWYLKILEDAEIIDSRYPAKGMLVYRRWGLFIIRQMQRELEMMLEEHGHEPVLFPVVIPEDTLGKETEHIAGFENQVFWITHAGSNPLDKRLALRPTSETPIYEMFRIWIRSHGDLPLKVHQSCAVYRYETKHTRPLIRGREFLWNEGHSAHRNLDDALGNIDEIKNIYKKLINEILCIPFIINKRPDWDKFPGAMDTFAFDTLMPNGRTLQIATAHNLGQNFSKVFDIKFENEKGEQEYVWQTSYGPSFGRLLAAVISIHGDEKGLVLPPEIAPVQIVIIPIVFKESEKWEILKYANEIKNKLKSIRTEIDNGEERPGAKFYHWEMKGVPLRFEIGPRDLTAKKITAVRRDTGEKFELNSDDIRYETIEKILNSISDNMRKMAEERFKDRFFRAESSDDIKKYIGRGIIAAGFCGGNECGEKIMEIGNILSADDEDAKCSVCGKIGKDIRIAKSY